MKDHWYPLMFAKSLTVGHPHATTLFGESLILSRDPQGRVRCLADRNAQRCNASSLSPVYDGPTESDSDGWHFDREGWCTELPARTSSQLVSTPATLRSYPVIERGGMIWVWPGKKVAADPALLTMADEVVPPGWAAVDLALDWQMDSDQAIEIILDQAHVPFVPVEVPGDKHPVQPLDLVIYNRSSGFQGGCRYPNQPVHFPLWITFTRPSTVRIDLLFKQAGPLLEQGLPPSGTQLERRLIKEDWVFLSQLFYVVPLAPGKTRVLTRTLRSWATWMPFMDLWMRRLVKKIMAQELAVLQAQQLRTEQGPSPWSCPVRADGLPLAYRRWRSGMETAQGLD